MPQNKRDKAVIKPINLTGRLVKNQICLPSMQHTTLIWRKLIRIQGARFKFLIPIMSTAIAFKSFRMRKWNMDNCRLDLSTQKKCKGTDTKVIHGSAQLRRITEAVDHRCTPRKVATTQLIENFPSASRWVACTETILSIKHLSLRVLTTSYYKFNDLQMFVNNTGISLAISCLRFAQSPCCNDWKRKSQRTVVTPGSGLVATKWC